jgi:dGTPase
MPRKPAPKQPNAVDEHRTKRRHADTKADQRSAFQRDRDRIIYSSAFRRLAGVTQVVAAGEGHMFHNRLTHTVKVAQIGRRLAESLLEDPSQRKLANEFGLDPEVVEAACLAHDLGHPPFGHVGEQELNKKVLTTDPDEDGYEGNAQSFRILTKLSVRHVNCDGLNLTRATLAATLKYPWLWQAKGKYSKKWSAYRSEKADFDFARDGIPAEIKTAEADLMDWADDIAYSVHDLEDFHRAGMVPWPYLTLSETERERVVKETVDSWWNRPADLTIATERVKAAANRLYGILPDELREPYSGTRSQRQKLRWWTSQLVGRYIEAIKLRRPTADNPRYSEIDENFEDEVRYLKQLTRRYVINNPTLAAQQHGQRKVVSDLFDALLDSLRGPANPKVFPTRFAHFLEQRKTDEPEASHVRLAADCIASMTEQEAFALHKRLNGIASGSILDPIFR